MNPRKQHAGFALTVLFAINLMNFFDRTMLGPVAEPIRKEWHLSDSQIGWLATAFTLLYAVVGVPLGRLSDRRNRTRILSLGVAVWSLLTAATGFAWNFAALFMARLGVGIGEASCAPASNSLIGDFYPAALRARALSVFMLGLPIGIFLSNLVSGRIAAAYNWRAAFYVACVPGLLLAGLVLLISEPRRGAAEFGNLPSHLRIVSPSWYEPYWHILGTPTMLWIIISGALYNFNSYAMATFLPAFLIRYHSLNLKQATGIAAILLGALGVPGLLVGGWAADRIRDGRSIARLLVPAAALGMAAPLLFLALWRPAGDLTPFVVLLGAGWTLQFMYYGGVYAAVQDVVRPELRGTAMALYFCAMYLLGGSFGPVLTGRLSDIFARRAMLAAGASSMEPFRASGLHAAMYVIPACCALLAAVLFAASRTIDADMHALRTGMQEAPHEPRIPVSARTATQHGD
jgi:MFS family permease